MTKANMTADQLEDALRKMSENSGLTSREIFEVLEVLCDEFEMLANDEEDDQ